MKNKFFIGVITFMTMIVFTGCSEKHLINNPEKRDVTIKAFEAKTKLFDKQLFDIVNDKSVTAEEREALQFLYAYAPLSDLTYSPDNYLAAVRATLDARKVMPWADSISEDVFLHFVLPLRVNNENMDSSRVVFYELLRDRVKGMSLKDAALEVNHWCHENVIYTPSDGRTSSPLASLKSAYGRCGEESVFCVAALRAAGIPARQVYTPRWAHSDDNHAWVEIWGGDKWYYMGACEPDPRLDMGWFTAPSMRGMLMHTKVYGDYNGAEEVMMKNPLFTEINVTDNYAETKKMSINVVDKAGNPVDGAHVEVKVYNYADFYTVANKTTDKEGKTSISLGLGDVVLWATKDGMSGFTKMSVKTDDSATVVIDKNLDKNSVELDIVPPVEKQPVVVVEETERAANSARSVYEDSLRNSYVASFMNTQTAEALADNLSLDKIKVVNYIVASRGNYNEIARYLSESVKRGDETVLDMLRVISAKDLRDITADILLSHAEEAKAFKDKYPKEIFDSYLLNPRVSSEMIDAYRAPLKRHYGDNMDIKAIIDVASKVRINDELNSAVSLVRPITVMTINMADKRSRNIFFVALARTYGIASRLDPTTNKPQYYNGENWVDVNFESQAEVVSPKGTMTVTYKPIPSVPDPAYETHYTISKLQDDGHLSLIYLPRNTDIDMGAGETVSSTFKTPCPIEAGNYMLTTGTRMANGSVLATLSFFTVEDGKNTNVNLVLRENREDIFVLGSIDPEARVTPVGTSDVKSILDITGRGYFILALVGPRQEPTNHAMRNIAKIKESIDQWGRPVVVVFKDEAEYAKYDAKEFGQLPEINYVIDSEGKVAEMLKGLEFDTNTDLPVFVIADTFGRVVYKTAGYQINLGDNIQKVLTKL